MNTAWARSICRLLIALMALAPYQVANAGLIGTEHVVAAATQAERSTVLNFVTRTDVASQLQALGIDPTTAKDRVAAMTDEEVRALAAQIDSLPAGADAVGGVGGDIGHLEGAERRCEREAAAEPDWVRAPPGSGLGGGVAGRTSAHVEHGLAVGQVCRTRRQRPGYGGHRDGQRIEGGQPG